MIPRIASIPKKEAAANRQVCKMRLGPGSHDPAPCLASVPTSFRVDAGQVLPAVRGRMSQMSNLLRFIDFITNSVRELMGTAPCEQLPSGECVHTAGAGGFHKPFADATYMCAVTELPTGKEHLFDLRRKYLNFVAADADVKRARTPTSFEEMQRSEDEQHQVLLAARERALAAGKDLCESLEFVTMSYLQAHERKPLMPIGDMVAHLFEAEGWPKVNAARIAEPLKQRESVKHVQEKQIQQSAGPSEKRSNMYASAVSTLWGRAQLKFIPPNCLNEQQKAQIGFDFSKPFLGRDDCDALVKDIKKGLVRGGQLSDGSYLFIDSWRHVFQIWLHPDTRRFYLQVFGPQFSTTDYLGFILIGKRPDLATADLPAQIVPDAAGFLVGSYVEEATLMPSDDTIGSPGRKPEYQEAFALVCERRPAEKWRVIYEECKRNKIDVPDDFETFQRTMQKKLRAKRGSANPPA